MNAAIRGMATPALLSLAAVFTMALAAAPAAADRAYVTTETIFLDRPGPEGRMLGQYLTCDEVRTRDTWRGWVLVQGRRGEGWVQRGVLTSFQPGACRYEYRPRDALRPVYPVVPPVRPPHPVRPPAPDRPPFPVQPPRPERPPHPERPPRPERPWQPQPEPQRPYWGP